MDRVITLPVLRLVCWSKWWRLTILIESKVISNASLKKLSNSAFACSFVLSFSCSFKPCINILGRLEYDYRITSSFSNLLILVDKSWFILISFFKSLSLAVVDDSTSAVLLPINFTSSCNSFKFSSNSVRLLLNMASISFNCLSKPVNFSSKCPNLLEILFTVFSTLSIFSTIERRWGISKLVAITHRWSAQLLHSVAEKKRPHARLTSCEW